MEFEYSIGFVTFADVLGWKGIWQTNNYKDPVNSLIEIKDTISESISLMNKRYFEYLLNDEIKDYVDSNLKKEMLYYIFRRNLNVNEAINKTYKSKDDLDKFKVLIDTYLVSIKIDLISDTFIITSNSKNRPYEFLSAHVDMPKVDPRVFKTKVTS